MVPAKEVGRRLATYEARGRSFQSGVSEPRPDFMTVCVADEAWGCVSGRSFHAVAFPGELAGAFHRRRRKGGFPSDGVRRSVFTISGMILSPNIVRFGSDQMNGCRRPPTTNLPATQKKIQLHWHS